MPKTITCDKCKGKGGYDALISQHGNETEYMICKKCKGKKVVYQMTDEEERDYYDSYW